MPADTKLKCAIISYFIVLVIYFIVARRKISKHGYESFFTDPIELVPCGIFVALFLPFVVGEHVSDIALLVTCCAVLGIVVVYLVYIGAMWFQFFHRKQH